MTMKRPLVITSLLFISFTLYSEDGFIGLSNKTKKSENETIEKIEKENISNSDEVIKNIPIIPKSFYIGELGDFDSLDFNRNRLLKKVDTFMTSVKNGGNLKGIDPGFSFIFDSVYQDTLLKNRKDLTHWYLGYVSIEKDRAWIKIEIHYRDNMSTGVIYLEEKKEWLVTDLQLQDREKGFFDPSSSSRY